MRESNSHQDIWSVLRCHYTNDPLLWLGRKELNSHLLGQNQPYCHYTTSQFIQ